MEKRVTLVDMLVARENRANLQKELNLKYKSAVISYTLNIAGPIKRFPIGDCCFYEGKEEIEKQLSRNGWSAAKCVLTDAETGLECLWAVDADALKLKSAMAALEEWRPLGRLFDIDIIAEDGSKISREAIGLPERACIICGKPAAGCARSRSHSLDEIQYRTNSIMEDHFRRKDAQFIAKNAVRSLLYEASATPKPGLVDRTNNGAHDDMDFFTFIDSASALFTYFHDMAHAGLTSRSVLPENLLTRLRYRGITAEEEMFSATGGINTHKGLIFSMGIICAACGYLGPPFTSLDEVLQTAAQIAAPALCNDLEGITVQNSVTHGQIIFAKFGVTGIRGEAAAGFPSVRYWGLPVLRKALKSGSSYNDAGIEALLHLIANVNDTNIISRSSPDTLKTLQTRLQAFLNAQPDSRSVLEYAAKLDAQFIKENISPGGCADLLAITYMLHFLTN